jgi:gamma-polyglutamate synthase
MIEWLIITLSICSITLLVYEKWAIDKYRKSFRHVIHVAGTRGKSTVTRMIGHVLAEQGLRTFYKVTGTIPMYIDVFKKEHIIKRRGKANIREQIKMMRLAYKQKAEVLVIENMAVKDDYVKITQHQMLKANIVIITNSRIDHQEENTNQKEFYNFHSIVPCDGELFIENDDLVIYEDIALERHSRVHSITQNDSIATSNIENENTQFALAIGKHLGFSTHNILKALKTYPKDIGQFNLYNLKGKIWINAFSINDYTSLKKTYQSLLTHPWIENKTFSVLINNRSDRPLRAIEHLRLILKIQPQKVYVIGAFYYRFKRQLKPIEVYQYNNINDLNEQVIFAFGNIQDKGFEVMKYLEENGVKYDG